MEAAALKVAKELLDPHAPSVVAHGFEAGLQAGNQPPRGILALGPVVDQLDRAEAICFRDADLFKVAPLAFGRIETSALVPVARFALALGTAHAGVRT